MSRADGKETRERILHAAEELFSERGFDGTSIDRIAKTAGVNKALIYYYFEDKNDIVVSLFRSVVEELAEYVGHLPHVIDPRSQHVDMRNKIIEEIRFMAKRKKILSVLLMESLKDRNKDKTFFQCAELVINHELNAGMKPTIEYEKESSERQRYIVHEFFTGFIPVVAFVAFQDKWCEYFGCDRDELLEYFMDAFERTHLASHK